MEKSIRLLKLLSGNRTYSLYELQDRFDVSERTVYRYLNQIENAGFVLDRNNGRYRLAQDSPEIKSINKLFHFTEEEAQIFHHSLTYLEMENEVVNRLFRKLHSLYDFKALKKIRNSSNIEKVKQLSNAINEKKQVLLRNYRSSNSSTVCDRKVEPFQFMEDYKAIWCLDVADGRNKQFKISRIDDVELTEIDWKHERLHETPFFDAFRMTSTEPTTQVKAILTLKAYNLIREEYPSTEQYLTKENDRYVLEIPIADFHGIGRFVLGLPGDVFVKGPEEFKSFLNKKRKKFFD